MYRNVALKITMFASSIFLPAYSDEDSKIINLCPDIIAIIDGKSFGIHGELVGAVYKIARDVQAMQLGKRTPAGRIGMYKFQGNVHSIRSLAVIEQANLQELKRATGDRRVACEKCATELGLLLAKIKQDFKAIVSPFLGQARGAKEPMFMLISESVTKRNRPNSMLLDWAHSSEDEMVSFDKSVTTFALFDEFCTDLVNFLGDLVGSCPKARAQFEKLKEDYIRRQAATKK
jgi:hypothetical protein